MTDAPVSAAPPTRRERFPTGPWTAAAVAACGCVAVGVVDPREHAMSPPCPFRTLTGWWCPFCGATRAASRLLHADVGSALRYNAPFVVLLPLVLTFWVAWAFPARFPRLDPLRRHARPVISSIAALLVVFVVVRNTPLGETWLRYPGA